jgi:peptidoglycan/xylan/chitin deacetylase (PgdA/CDA1 family)
MSVRLDRWISTVVIYRFLALKRRICGESGAQRLPILMYHSISDCSERGVSAYYRTATSPARFREQLQMMKDKGWRGVTLKEAVQALSMEGEETRRPEKLVALTFDDGYRDFYTTAAPILKEFNFRATMYLATDYVESGEKFKGKECLNWNEVEELFLQGFEFGSHTRTHPKLVEISSEQLSTEVALSKSAIEERLGVRISSFAYPYAYPRADVEFTERLCQLLRASGYTNCVTTEIGREKEGTDMFRLKRIPVNGADDETLLRAKLEGAYDWLAIPQRVVKTLKSFLPDRRARRVTADVNRQTSS